MKSPSPRTLPCAAAALSLVLTACAAPPAEQFHTLRPLPSRSQATSAVPPSQTATILSTQVTVVVGPVTIPTSADRPQWMVRRSGTQVQVQEQQRWVQPLANEIAEAVAQHLSQTHQMLAEVDAADQRTPGATKPPVRVQLRVTRFENLLLPSTSASIDDEIYWTVRCNTLSTALATPPVAGASGDARAGLFTASRQVPVQAGLPPFDALAKAHAEALTEVSRRIATAVDELKSRCSQR